MYEKVLLATDGSDESKAAAREINKFIKQGIVKKLTILNVCNTFADLYDVDVSPISVSEMDKAAEGIGQKIASDTREIITENIDIMEKASIGDPARTICETAQEEGSDLIVMGSRGRNPISGLLLGSVSTRVLQLAPCPVLIVKK